MNDQDLTRFLNDWAPEAGRINARRITGDDGREKIQVRIELGVLQMEAEGRPDGMRPEGHASLLDLQLDRLDRYVRTSESPAGFVLSTGECRALREEAVQYYHRYVALFALGDHEAVVRDAVRNLRVLDLCRDFGETEIDRTLLDQFRPHVITMRTRAEAEMAISDKEPKLALAVIDRGLEELRAFFTETGHGTFDQSNEVTLLRGMRDMLVPKLPASQRVELEERLRSAIDAENYELAAILRDELRMMER